MVLKLTRHGHIVTAIVAVVVNIRLGHHGHPEAEGPVVVEDPQKQENAADDDEAVLVEEDDGDGSQGGEEEQVLAPVQAPLLVADVLMHDVRQRSRGGQTVVCGGQADSCRQRPAQEEY